MDYKNDSVRTTASSKAEGRLKVDAGTQGKFNRKQRKKKTLKNIVRKYR